MSTSVTRETLLQARVHHGHLAKKWNPRFAPFIFMKRQGMHVIDLDQTEKYLVQAGEAMKELVASGKKILFVGVKKQAKAAVEATAKELGQPYVTEKLLGGLLTNFNTIRKLMKKMSAIDSLAATPAGQHLPKREKLILARKYKKLEIILAGITSLARLPGALFVTDVVRDKQVILEAHKLRIPVFGIVDSNANPDLVTYPIPANDDAEASIAVIMNYLRGEIAKGLALWKNEKTNKGPHDQSAGY